MSVLSAQTIRRLNIVTPFEERTQLHGMSYGLGPCGYDVRLDQNILMAPNSFVLASTMEQFRMPTNIVAYVKDKSSWARRGIMVQSTVIEPAWEGYLTLELTNHSGDEQYISMGSPIAQIVFHWLDEPTEHPYDGKYMGQSRGPQKAR